MAVGAFIGSVPRAFVYTALGASIGNRSPVLAYAAIGVWCVTAIVGAFAARSGFRKWRTTAKGVLTFRREQAIPSGRPRVSASPTRGSRSMADNVWWVCSFAAMRGRPICDLTWPPLSALDEISTFGSAQASSGTGRP